MIVVKLIRPLLRFTSFYILKLFLMITLSVSSTFFSLFSFFASFLSFFSFSFLSNDLLLWLWHLIYLRSSLLQNIFSYHILEPQNSSSASREHFSENFSKDFTQQLCHQIGLTCQKYTLLTEDGYELTLHRCSLPSHSSLNLPSILLLHGLMQDSESFLVGGSSNSLVHSLVHAGYDVWLGNNRGTHYSQHHLNYHRGEKEYWDYSIDDLAAYDVPAMVHFILQHTHQPKLALIGFSQGSTQTFASFSYNPSLNSKISIFIALSPALKTTGLQSTTLQDTLQIFFLICLVLWKCCLVVKHFNECSASHSSQRLSVTR